MSAVFLDTVGLIAVWDVADQWHPAAERVFQQLLSERAELRTTSYVLLECGNAACRRPYRTAVERLKASLEMAGRLEVPTESDWKLAWQAYQRRDGNNAGIVDCTSFVVMQRLGIREVFSNDEHFRAAGFETMF